ncbi:MAG: excinuclease ABC subunit UvrC [Candidatus Daviesbacteria bacterium]|nr:excinuclease ABC subunit UvrC [Candidatus Daviesbacteria bacterium]
MISAFFNRSKIPRQPGVYIYKDKTGKILYVGKAIDLHSRVSSYFYTKDRDSKTQALVSEIAKVETIIVESELEALILEANLIKKYLPPFNVRLTDDKDYLYIIVTKDDFPKILTARKKDLKGAKEYWGPFPSSRTVKETLKSLRRVFPWCSVASQGLALRIRPCFYYHLGQCPGACVGLTSRKDYQKIISSFSKFMDGKKDELVANLLKEMTEESKYQRFETASRIKKILDGITYMTQPNRVKLYLENPNFLEEERQLALKQLKKDLNLEKLPERIEGYDISNIAGKEATGSMVVLTNGEIDKREYRKFKILISGKPNDVGMMAEMVSRRLKHKEWPLPDLIIVDGGRGQVNSVNDQLQITSCRLPIFGLAKRMEWLYPPEGEVLKLPRKSLSLKLLQKLRDEAHRFAISYHRKLHRKSILRP